MVPLKCFNNFSRALEMSSIKCQTNLILTWSASSVIVFAAVANQGATFAIKFPVVNLSTQDNVKLLDQIKTDFKRAIKSNKYQSIATIQTQNQYVDYLNDPSFEKVNRHFVLSFEVNAHLTSYKPYFLPTIIIKYYNVMINGKNFFWWVS